MNTSELKNKVGEGENEEKNMCLLLLIVCVCVLQRKSVKTTPPSLLSD